VKYREVRLQDEFEQSTYAFGRVALEGAEFGAFHRDLFERYHSLSQSLLNAHLVFPALEHCLKCSHLFNILDSSNSIGVTERAAYILRIRHLALGIAKQYVEAGASTPAVAAGA
jgi:glycyl-tRNA synthetase alpha chain